MERTIPDLMFSALERDPDRLSLFWPEDGVWKAMTRHEGMLETAGLARGLAAIGVEKGTPVAILAETRPDWVACDLAILALGAITVGIYPSMLPEQIAYQLQHSETRILIAENAALASKVDRATMEHVFVMEPGGDYPTLASLSHEPDLDWLRQRSAAVEPEDVATYIYTSGTTGNPKGAILTHANFVFVSHATLGLADIVPGDRAVVFLPLAHSFQRFTIYRGLLEDTVAYFAQSIPELPEALAAARPTVLASVPRMLEKIHHKALSAVEARGGVAKRLFDWAFAVGHERLAYVEAGKPVPPLVQLRFRLANRIVFRRVRERLGGELRVLVCGGAALNPMVARWFGAMGVTVLEGWGLTETSAPATVNREREFRFGTVGKPIDGVEVRIADDGEILVRGAGNFSGYYKDPEATAAAMEGDWFLTGDIGEFDEDGFLKITDRKKEILVTAGGKNIAPVNIEKRIERSPYVGQAVAIGSERPYLVALVVPDDEALDDFARNAGLPDEPLADRVRRPAVAALFQRAVDDANGELARYETIKKFKVLPTTFTVESGELTPTLKLKRRIVSERYATEIEILYG